jgi:hypothetical protein
MSVSDDEHTLQNLEEEKATIESRPHNGYTDAAHVVQLESEIDAVEDCMAREKQRAEHGEG